MATWLQLQTIKRVEIAGKMVTYQAGDYVQVGKEVGKYLAKQWVADGTALPIGPNAAALTETVIGGVVLRAQEAAGTRTLQAIFGAQAPETVASDAPVLPFARTLLWNPAIRLRPDVATWGFMRLDKWQVAAPLWRYDTLAADIGTAEDQERTKAVVHDLRIMVYEPGLVFIRRCPDTEALVALWCQEREGGGDERLAFMRALYQVKPTICACPPSWGGQR